MSDRLKIPTNDYTIKTCEVDGRKITYRAFENLWYCEKPVDPIQKLSIYVPEKYYHDAMIGPYDKKTAPIFLPNTVGGYLPGPIDEPGSDKHFKQANSLFQALEQGYVVVSVGIRGRTSGKKTTDFFVGSKESEPSNNTGRMVGRAPALIVDYKAAIRYLRYNKELIPGDTERIITNGTSAGGALSALAGASGNSPDFEPYLAALGAAKERDDIFAASCYCPIHNLENADSAYEWLFSGQNDYYRTKYQRTDQGIIRVPINGQLSPLQIELSQKLKALFPSYLNQLELTTETGEKLTLNEAGEGSFKDFVKDLLLRSATKELQTHENATARSAWSTEGSQIEQQTYLTIVADRAVELDWDEFVKKITRMKVPPAFDALDLSSPENEEFGDEYVDRRHFTLFSLQNSTVPEPTLADAKIVKAVNPVSYICEGQATLAKHWRIRHGTFDRDTALAIPIILATLLKDKGCEVDFELPWGIHHAGDYDLTELFTWINDLFLP